MDQHYNYIRRSGRMTRGQSRGYERVRERFLLEPAQLPEWSQTDGPLGVEIGFGMGQGLSAWAVERPDWSLLGVELYRPGVGALAQSLIDQDVENVCVIEQPAQEVLARVNPKSIDEVRILFPDPWPKKRHAKRRLIQKAFVSTLAQCLKPNGVLKMATDWAPYAAWMKEVLAGQSDFHCVLERVIEADDIRVENVAPGAEKFARFERTKFEQRGQKLGHRIHDLVYLCGANSETTVSK